jgi:ABC-type molybdenum transport system ATPase subunit/photorepair protein PhrA/tetratricopeptide (TPR) repeat protein
LFEYGEVDEAAARDDMGLEAGSPFVAMELADRGTVRDAMPVSDWKTVCRLLVQILDGLAYAHARGVVHRDLKPENFLLFDAGGNPDGEASGWRVKLADFGIAHAFGRERELQPSDLGDAAGTPLYMAPEQLRGRWREFGPWTDLYGLGCIAFELVCGRPPFDGDTAFEIGMKHEDEPPPRVDPRFAVPDELESWIHRAMAVDPERRFRRAADAAWALPGAVLAEAAGVKPDTAGAARGDGGAPDDSPAETRVESLAATVVFEEELDDRATTVAERAPTRASSGDADECSGRGTVAAAEAEERPVADEQPDRAGRMLETFRPPMPSNWRPEHTDPIPAPLVGAGLGLFGLREPPFVNRREACDQIWQALQRVVESGSCEAVFVAGEAGTGKSRLADWITTRAHEVGAARIIRAVHTSGGGSSEGLRGALDRTLRTVKMERGEVYDHLLDLLPSLTAGDDDLAEDDARALTEYLRPTDDGEAVDGPRFQFSRARQQRVLLARTLDRFADRRPLVLWLDDLQWGAEALGVLEYLRERRSEPPAMLVLATVRSDVVADRPALAERLDDLQTGDGWAQLPLTPLSRDHQRELLTGLLPLTADLADQLADRTEGHPLFAMQLLGHWIDGGALKVGPQGFALAEGQTLEVPADIHHLWIDRIDRLLELFGDESDDVLKGLELAAALGRQIDREVWHELLADAGFSCPEGLVDRLVERALAERTPDGWAFAHGLLVDSLARRARSSGRWERHHRRCARVLEARLTGDAPGPRRRIADHWVEGGRPERALEPLLDACRLANRYGRDEMERSMIERAGELLDRLEIPDDDPRRLRNQIRRASREKDRARLTAIWGQLDDDQPRLQTYCAFALSVIHARRSDRQRGRQWAERTLEASRRAALPHLQAKCHSRLAWNEVRDQHGDLDRAEYHVDRAIELAERADARDEVAERADARYEVLEGLRTRAVIRRARGGSEGGELLETVRRAAADEGYVALEARTINELGEQARFDGRLGEAAEWYRRYLEMARQLSRPFREAIAQLNLGQVALRTGDLDSTAHHLRETEHICEAIGAQAKQDTICLLRLGHAAGTEDRSTYEACWETLADGWPEDWRLIKDHPWLLETVGEYAREAGWEAQARQVWRLAAELWEELGDEEAAEELRERAKALLRK